jgi:hypothetical protein
MFQKRNVWVSRLIRFSLSNPLVLSQQLSSDSSSSPIARFPADCRLTQSEGSEARDIVGGGDEVDPGVRSGSTGARSLNGLDPAISAVDLWALVAGIDDITLG